MKRSELYMRCVLDIFMACTIICFILQCPYTDNFLEMCKVTSVKYIDIHIYMYIFDKHINNI